MILIKGMVDSKLSLKEVCQLVYEKSGIKISTSYLSKIRSGTKPPASDQVNLALANVLKIDPVDLLVSVYQEKVPDVVLEKLISIHNRKIQEAI